MADYGLLSGLARGVREGMDQYDRAMEKRLAKEKQEYERKRDQEELERKRKRDEVLLQNQLLQMKDKGRWFKLNLLNSLDKDSAYTKDGAEIVDDLMEDTKSDEGGEESPDTGLLERPAARGLISPKSGLLPKPPPQSPAMDREPKGDVDVRAIQPTEARENLRYQRALEKEARIERRQREREERGFARGMTKAEKTDQMKRKYQDDYPTQHRAAAAGFGARMRGSEDVFTKMEQEGFNRAAPENDIQIGISNSGVAGNLANYAKLIDPKVLGWYQAERDFVNAVLRRESGAAISTGEYKDAEKRYFPRPGDTAEILEQKRASRLAALASMEIEAGPALINRVGKIQKGLLGQTGFKKPDWVDQEDWDGLNDVGKRQVVQHGKPPGKK